MALPLKNDRNEIIEAALDLIGVVPAAEEPTAVDIQDGAAALNDMVKNWQSKGAHLWAQNEAFLFVQPGQVKYQFGDSSPDEATEAFTEDTLAANVASGSAIITLTTSTPLVNDRIGVELDTGVLFWSTVASLSPITLATVLPSAAASTNTVYFYTTIIGKALRVPDARRSQSGQDIEMLKMGRIDYFNLPNKLTLGTPVQFYYDPKISSGNMYLWPAPQSINTIIKFTYNRPLIVFSDADDEPDFPDEWIEVLKYNLALRRAPAYGVSAPIEVAALATSLMADTGEWDQDAADVSFQFSFGRGQ